MARKKKETVVEEDEVVEVPAEVDCPQHGGRYKLKVQMDGSKAFAVCDCNVRNNMWRGQRVWEMTPPRRQHIQVEEE